MEAIKTTKIILLDKYQPIIPQRIMMIGKPSTQPLPKSPYRKRIDAEIARRYAICRLHLQYARKYLYDGSVDQFWDAMKAFDKSRRVARAVRKLLSI